ncbi:CRP-like cAMP-binding protein [Chitinophaga niastensis]|uniref:CRP-like cAMP-binding protein n=1 Tax=Chitinophaga niastensis TaxID=536980 RepID=A0A2P8HJA0_CHINA|nr:Crp/Fnr family transcriptional regulator [Chitinophaga niastensis]PSL46291.1 CRP-like cAMP-binding protein [Chitinophaga niastensis]
MENIWIKIAEYGQLSEESKLALAKIIKKKSYDRNDFFLTEGQIPQTVGFVSEGLLSQYYTAENGDIIIKKFFPENHFVASTAALLKKSPSEFSIKVLEPATILEYNFHEFKQLTEKYLDIAAFYIRYMEIHWIIEKEPLEISFRHDTAKKRYTDFLAQFPTLESRLKQHEIASYLGITPTQLSRIRAGS